MTKHSEVPRLKEMAIELGDKLYHLKWIASAIGVDEKTIYNWLKNDEQFSSRLNQARAGFIQNNMRKAKPDFLLETADRETFGSRQQHDINLNVFAEIIAKYGGNVEGVISEVPRPKEIEERSPKDST